MNLISFTSLSRNFSRLKWSLFAASSLTVMSGAAIAPCLPQLKVRFQDAPYADLLIPMLLSIPALIVLVTAPIFGWIDDRYPKTRILKLSIFVYACSGVFAIFAESLSFLALTRVFLGLGVSGIMTSVTPLGIEYFRGPERDKFMGQMEAFVEVGGIVLLLLAGTLADFHLKAPFYLYTLGFVVWIMVYSSLPHVGSFKKIVPKPIEKIPSSLKTSALGIYAVLFLLMVAFYFLPTQLPFFMEQQKFSNAKTIALVISASQITGALASFKFSSFRKHLNYPQLLSLMSLLMAAGYLGLNFTHVIWQYFLLIAIFGVGCGLILPTLSLWIMDISDEKFHGRLSGGLSTALFAGQFASPLIAHPFIRQWGRGVLFTISGLCLFALACVIPFVVRNRHRRSNS